MQSLHLTYQTLAKSRNATATDVLAGALVSPEPEARKSAVQALLMRGDEPSADCILKNWARLQQDEIKLISGASAVMARSVVARIKADCEDLATAIDAASQIGVTEAIVPLIGIAESGPSPELKQTAGEAVLALVGPLGKRAREARDLSTIRGPIVTRLRRSVSIFHKHRNEPLVEAFLANSRWSDAGFGKFVTGHGATCDFLRQRLANSTHTGIVDLLAGFVRRRDVPESIRTIIANRDDELFRGSLLRAVGSEPNQTVRKSLDDIGLPACVAGGETILEKVAGDDIAATIQIYLATKPNHAETLHLIAAIAERDEPDWIALATHGFLKAGTLCTDDWSNALAVVVSGDEEWIANDNEARLLQRLLNLIECSDRGLLHAVREVLLTIRAETMLEQFEELDDSSRQRLGHVVMLVDAEVIDRIRDALRHPVLEKRMKAIAVAESLAIVDLLSNSFARIAREDHQEARILAARAMSTARNPLTHQLLEEMTWLPVCPARDAACEALRQRESAQPSRPVQRY